MGKTNHGNHGKTHRRKPIGKKSIGNIGNICSIWGFEAEQCIFRDSCGVIILTIHGVMTYKVKTTLVQLGP
jgi:hypothetical protein